ncbi:MAG: ribonuclease Y [Proteobacteria bacterium]|nr:MAG: ribonuclease Y [Pseudomonadota bacterium]
MFVYKKAADEKTKQGAAVEAEKVVSKARADAQRIDREAKQRAKDFEARAKANTEKEAQKTKQKLQQEEKSLVDKEAKLEKEFQNKETELEQRLQEIASRDEKVKIAEKRMVELEQESLRKQAELQSRIEAVSGLSAAEAKKEMVDALYADVRSDAAKRAIEIEEEAQADAANRARRVIALAVSRYASEYTSERTVSVINLPNEEMKGKIIGREGRNIRSMEAATGVDLIVDETPEAVVISSFDPVRREVARKSLEKLMEDGRVHPARIEEVTDKVKKEIFKNMKEDGEKAVFELGLAGIHPEIVKVLGSLKYRHTMTQNVLQHSIEVGFLAGMMAGELGIDQKRARRAGLLHDIGKGLDHTLEGSHAMVGADFCKKYGEHDTVVHAVRAHHDEEKPNSILALIVQAANVLSNSRPGARKASMDTYIRRMEDMESIGNSFDGVVRTFAVQTGKELRVLVEASRVTDEQASMLSYDIARKIERELSHAGQVKVSVVREVRVVEHAR